MRRHPRTRGMRRRSWWRGLWGRVRCWRTRCLRFRRGASVRPRRLAASLPPGFLCGGRLGGPGEPGWGLRGRCRWVVPPRTGRRRWGAGWAPRGMPRRPGDSGDRRWCRGRCSWAGLRVGRTAGSPGGTGCCRPRTGTRCPCPWVRSPRTGTRRCAVRSAAARGVRVAWIPRAEWAGCRNATSGTPGSPSCAVCTGRCRTRTLFRCSLHSRAPKTCLIYETSLTSRLTGAPQERPATGQGRNQVVFGGSAPARDGAEPPNTTYPPRPAANRPDIVALGQRSSHTRCVRNNDIHDVRPRSQLRPKSWTQLPGP
jgi:hypothetical protein